MSAKQAINDKLQGSVTTYLRCGGVVNNQIKIGLLLSVWVIFFKSVNIRQRYKQERGCLMHFACAPGQHTAKRRKFRRRYEANDYKPTTIVNLPWMFSFFLSSVLECKSLLCRSYSYSINGTRTVKTFGDVTRCICHICFEMTQNMDTLRFG